MAETDIKLQEYEAFLKELAETDSDTIITNGGKDHAVVLYSVLLDNTKEKVRIFCQSGSSVVWQDQKFINAMESFLNKDNTQLEVLTAEEPALSTEWTNKRNVKAYQISDTDKDKIYTHFRNRMCNFAVFDDKRYRYEYDCLKFKAFGSFNSPKTCQQMIELFDEAFNSETITNV